MNFWCSIGFHPPNQTEWVQEGMNRGYRKCNSCGKEYDHKKYGI